MAEISLEKKALASGAMKTCFKARVLEGDSEQLSPALNAWSIISPGTSCQPSGGVQQASRSEQEGLHEARISLEGAWLYGKRRLQSYEINDGEAFILEQIIHGQFESSSQIPAGSGAAASPMP